MPNATPSFRSSSLTLTVLCPLSMLTDNPLLRSAILGSKNAMAIMTLFPLIVG
jgi:hypothetical protein